jgi:transcriptional regulator with XRE-family HTH domain
VAARRSPTMRRRRLGIELRRIREHAGFTIEEVAKALECSDSKISRIETGQVGATPRDVRDMLQVYGVAGERREALIETAREARQKDWWQEYGDNSIVPLAGLEAAAAMIRTYEPMFVPGLFQTRRYAELIIPTFRPELRPDEVDRRVQFRMERQTILARKLPPAIWAVLDEAVLQRLVGGHEIMREQLHRLIEVSELPSVTVQILLFEAGHHPGMTGPFAIFAFSDENDPDVVYLEHAESGLYIEHEDVVQRYSSDFRLLQNMALTAEESIKHLRRRAAQLT